MPARRALVRRPSPRLAEGLLTHLERTPVNVALAMRQWEAYVGTLVDSGWEVVEVPGIDECPDAAFVEDTVVMYGDLAVITRPGAPQRREETAGTEEVLRHLGYRIARIDAPGTLDGGDVLKHGGEVWVGLGGRTDTAGIEQLRSLLAEQGARVTAVPLTRALHLKSAVTALPDGTVVGWDPVVDDPATWPSYYGVPEEPGAHVVLLDAETVLMSAPAAHPGENRLSRAGSVLHTGECRRGIGRAASERSRDMSIAVLGVSRDHAHLPTHRSTVDHLRGIALT